METILNQGTAATDDVVKEIDQGAFMAEVIQASMQVPVIVDFWASWCGPCKQLGPLLEKVVRDARGAVRLVKIDIDRNQAIAQQMRIQSIPAVYAFKGGRAVDGFLGALPESQVKQFVARLIGGPVQSPVEEAIEEAVAALEAGDNATAGAIFTEVLNHEADNVQALAGLAHVALAENRVDEAEQYLAKIPEAKRSDPFVAKAASAVELARQTESLGDIAGLERAVAADPNDHQARFDYAMALYARGKGEEAADQLLELFRRDRNWNDQAARKQLLKFFEAWGPTHELTVSVRRKLSSLMFS